MRTPRLVATLSVVTATLILGVYLAANAGLPKTTVVINERTGSIVISGDVQIGDVVVSHKNIVVDATVQVPPFTKVDQQEGGDSAKLTALVDALNALKVPNADAIDIIKNIERSGKLHGHLIIE